MTKHPDMTEMRMTNRKPLSAKAMAFVVLGGGLLLGAVAGWLDAGGEGRGSTGELALRVALVIGLIAGAAYSLSYWRRLDEAAREAHKWAWYWGGSIGLLPAGFLAATPTPGVRLAGELGFKTGPELLQFGAMGVVGCMIVGYLVAWGFWWLRRR